MPRRLIIRASFLLAWLLGTAIILIWETSQSGAAFFFTHPVATGLLTSLVTLLLTVFLLDEALRERDRRHWSKFVVLAYRALAQEAEDVRYKLLRYLGGPSPRLSIGAIADDDLLGPTQPAISRIENLAEADMTGRISVLAEDLEWARATYVGIRSIKRQNWDALFRFAPILVAHSDTADALNRFALLNESLVQLERLFEEYAQNGWQESPRENWGTCVADQWLAVVRAAISLENGLHASVTQLSWVSEADLEALLERHT